MYKQLQINSKIRTYFVDFTDDVFNHLKNSSTPDNFYIIDSIVYDLYSEQFKNLLVQGNHILIEANENHKSYSYCEKVISNLIQLRIKKTSKIVAIGGGIIQDISSFIASILFRGIDWVFIPTTLLAQADSCIGGKTSINFGEIKNTLGNFYPPNKIFIDLNFLSTLSSDDIKSGIGEMLHFYFYNGSDYIDKLFIKYTDLLTGREGLKEFILESLRIKKSVIEMDEFDKGERNKFNYGHTFGHAIESITNYGIKHGQAVTLGMDLANMISAKLGLIPDELFKSLHAKLRLNFPQYDLSDINVEKYISILSKDKKNVDEQLVCILLQDIGNLVKMKVPMNDDFKTYLKDYFQSVSV